MCGLEDTVLDSAFQKLVAATLDSVREVRSLLHISLLYLNIELTKMPKNSRSTAMIISHCCASRVDYSKLLHFHASRFSQNHGSR
jgi:hypothetical protein